MLDKIKDYEVDAKIMFREEAVMRTCPALEQFLGSKYTTLNIAYQRAMDYATMKQCKYEDKIFPNGDLCVFLSTQVSTAELKTVIKNNLREMNVEDMTVQESIKLVMDIQDMSHVKSSSSFLDKKTKPDKKRKKVIKFESLKLLEWNDCVKTMTKYLYLPRQIALQSIWEYIRINCPKNEVSKLYIANDILLEYGVPPEFPASDVIKYLTANSKKITKEHIYNEEEKTKAINLMIHIDKQKAEEARQKALKEVNGMNMMQATPTKSTTKLAFGVDPATPTPFRQSGNNIALNTPSSE
eukprot:NODE_438_length_7412_cov_0.582798.p5 type:complete len:297 gc:universal NODE_438_length_7412_cov_0.582798:2135-1245(-)